MLHFYFISILPVSVFTCILSVFFDE